MQSSSGIKLNRLKIFKVVATSQNFNEAAQSCHLTKSAVSKQIKLLEDSLNKALFVRQNENLELTVEGKYLLDQIIEPLDSIERAIQRVTGMQQRKSLKINAPFTLSTRCILPKLKQFHTRFPDLEIRVDTSLILESQINRELAARNFNYILMYLKAIPTNNSLRLLRLEKNIAVASPTLWSRDMPPSVFTTPLIHMVEREEQVSENWDAWFSSFGADVLKVTQGGIYLNTLDQVIKAAIDGVGIGLVDESMVRKELAEGKLKKISDHCSDGPYGYWLLDVKTEGIESLNLEQLLFRELLDRAISEG